MTSYPLAQHSWNDPDVITVASKDDQLIATFPMEFFQRSGVPVWEYMYDVIAQLLDGPGKGQLYKADGTAVTTADEVDPGEYCFVLDSAFIHSST